MAAMHNRPPVEGLFASLPRYALVFALSGVGKRRPVLYRYLRLEDFFGPVPEPDPGDTVGP